MGPRLIYIKKAELIYSHQSGMYWKHPITGEKLRTQCEPNSRDIVDQLVRTAYFTYGYNVIYMDMFYPDDYQFAIKFWGPREAPNTYPSNRLLPF